jgi:fructose/tagatose bisphosphate aldolase
MVNGAMARGYAVGYFESWNLESLQGVVDAAEATRSPVLIGFNGQFLSRPNRRTRERLGWYAALARAAAGSSTVPCGLVFNECAQDDWVRQAVDAGFGQVMLDDPDCPHGELERRVAELTEYAHRHHVASEAQVGELPFGEAPRTEGGHGMTQPEEAAEFVRRTGVDILGISVGNVHALTKGSGRLDIGRIAAIRRRVSLPFDLHGGTGIDSSSLREAIQLGVAKVSFGTYMKQRYLAAIGQALTRTDAASNPHKLLGLGESEDLLVAGRLAVRDAVLERIQALGCRGKA